MASLTTVATVYALGAATLAVALIVLLHFLEPEFNPSWRMLSEYSLGRYGLLMRVAFLALGTSVIAVAVALWPVAEPWCLALVLVALGPLGAAFIDTDPITTPRAQISRRSNLHAVLGSLFILGFPLAAIIAGIGAASDPTVGSLLAWAAIVPLGTLVWFIGANVRYARPDGVGGPEAPVGWPNRMNILADLGWVALAAVTLLR